MSPKSADDRTGTIWAALVPELLVTDLGRSISFYCELCGFSIRFARTEDGFAYIERGKAQLMLEEVSEGSWLTGPLERPYGRGMNLQIEVSDVATLHDRLLAAGARIFEGLKTQWYREGGIEHGQSQFLVQDPDGYLLRFMQHLGERPAVQGK
jgi:catechol 2,3-dioxygenase-like lactoylglutathione lyase family enzyme